MSTRFTDLCKRLLNLVFFLSFFRYKEIWNDGVLTFCSPGSRTTKSIQIKKYRFNQWQI